MACLNGDQLEELDIKKSIIIIKTKDTRSVIFKPISPHFDRLACPLPKWPPPAGMYFAEVATGVL
jgi:hypothetical protein